MRTPELSGVAVHAVDDLAHLLVNLISEPQLEQVDVESAVVRSRNEGRD